MNYLLFNPKANNSANDISIIGDDKFPGGLTKISLIGLDVPTFLEKLCPDDKIILCGGDGTVNRFANDAYGVEFPCPVLLMKSGTGNDFLRDIGEGEEGQIRDIREYLRSLPTVTINGVTTRYINGIGFGIDGQVCEEADIIKEHSDKKINYTTLAVKLLLFKYKKPNAKVTVDGVTREYKNVWIASAMNGRYYGGGMMVAPTQDRLSGKLSVMVMHGGTRLKALSVFPSIFSGGHIKHKDMVDIFEADEVTVEFDIPTALQIDGETNRGVISYSARSVNAQKKAAGETAAEKPALTE